MSSARRTLVVTGVLAASCTALAQAQQHVHVEGMRHSAEMAHAEPPAPAGQAAFAAIADVVARLDRDSTVDWNAVNIEALRQHLIDMDNVVLRSVIVATAIPGGFRADITSEHAAVTASIRRMLMAHVGAMADSDELSLAVNEVPGGARLVAMSRQPGDERSVARIRGLGVVGILVLGNHHPVHHEALARGAHPH